MSAVQAAIGMCAPKTNTAVMFSGSVTKLEQNNRMGTSKQDMVFEERPEAPIQTVVDDLDLGKNVFVYGEGGCGKTMYMQEALKRVAQKGIPTFPALDQITPVADMLDPPDKLMKFLKDNKEERRVVVALDELYLGFMVPDTLVALKAIQAEYPNCRFLATSDSGSIESGFAGPDETAFMDTDFARKIELQPIKKGFKQFKEALQAAHFTIAPDALTPLEGFFGTTYQDTKGAFRRLINVVVTQLRQGQQRIDNDQPEVLSKDLLAAAIPDAFKA